MDKPTHYLRIVFAEPGRRFDAIVGDVAGKVFFALHDDRAKTGFALPVGLLSSRKDPDDFGHGIAVFGTEEELTLLTTVHSRTGKDATLAGAVISKVTPVPADCAWAVHRRFRKDRFSRMGADRAARRAAKRVEEGKSTATPEGVRAIAEHRRMKDREMPRLPFVRVPAYTRDDPDMPPRTAVIYVDTRPADGFVPGTFNGYGLSSDGASVPVVG